MHPLLKKRFKDDFPQILGLDDAEFRCYAGWGRLLYAFFEDATDYCKEHGGQIKILQIKEKFGKLRIYCSCSERDDHESDVEYVPEAFGKLFSMRPYPESPTLSKIVTWYEMSSEHVCEVCGRAGHIDDAVVSKLKWATTLCYEHAKMLIDAESSEDGDDVDFAALEEDVAKRILLEINDMKRERQ